MQPYTEPKTRLEDEPEVTPAPPPGQQALVLAGLLIGLLLLGIQLWLLTVALDLYLAGAENPLWLLPVVSGLIFSGGLFMLWLLRKQQRPPR